MARPLRWPLNAGGRQVVHEDGAASLNLTLLSTRSLPGNLSEIFSLLATSDSQLQYAWKYKLVLKLMNFVGVWFQI